MISVLMTAYNRERFIRPAIDSVLNSSYREFELIVVDDKSSDETASIAEDYARVDSRVRVFRNETNLGDYPNRNLAASYAGGDYLKFVDSDDIIYRHGLEVMLQCIERFPTAGLALSAVESESGPYPDLLVPIESYRQHYFGPRLLGRAPGSAIIRRSAFESVGGFSGRRQVGDHELWLKLAARFDLVRMPRDLIWSRAHGDQEQFQDTVCERVAMHEAIMRDALASEDCPLGDGDRQKASELLVSESARNYWRFLVGGHGFAQVNDYRRRSNISIKMLARQLIHRPLHPS